MPWTIDYYSEEVRLEIDALPADIRASYTRLTELLEEVWPRSPYAPFTGNGRRVVRAPAEGTRGNCTGVLLHKGGQEDHHAPLVHQEEAGNAKAGA